MAFEGDRAVALALLRVPLSRAEEVATLAGRVSDARAAVVLGGAVTVLVEVDGADLDELEPKLADVLAVAGGADTEVLVTTTELGVGRGGGEAYRPARAARGSQRSGSPRRARCRACAREIGGGERRPEAGSRSLRRRREPDDERRGRRPGAARGRRELPAGWRPRPRGCCDQCRARGLPG